MNDLPVTAPRSLFPTRLGRLAMAGFALACVVLGRPVVLAAGERPQLSERTSEELGKLKEMADAKNWEAALRLLANLQADTNPDSYDSAFISQIKAKILMEKGDYANAIEPMEFALRSSDSHDYLEARDTQELVYYLANLYYQEASTTKSPPLQQQYFTKAADYAQRWLQASPKPGQDQMRQEVQLLFVTILYNQAVINPEHVNLALIKKAQVEIENALVRINRPKETFYVLLIAALQNQGDYARAADLLELLVRQYPAKKEYWAQLVPIYLNLAQDKDADKARAYNTCSIITIERAQALGLMKTPKENFNLVGLYFNAGQFGKATELLHSGLKNGAIAAEQKNWELLAYSYQQVDKPYQAIEALKEATQQFPAAGQLDFQIATIYSSLDKTEEAYRYLTAAVAKGRLDHPAKAYYFLAYVSFELAKFNEALVAVDKAVATSGAEKESQLPQLKQAIEDAIRERSQAAPQTQ